jgi:hypothetical protein
MIIIIIKGELVSYLDSNCKANWSGRVWLDIEGIKYITNIIIINNITIIYNKVHNIG